MIKEDYCSYEVAKLLKEKGFDEACYSYYMTTKTLHTTFHNRVHVEEEPYFNSGDLDGMYDVEDKSLIEDICSAPTHQMTCKWLREVHNLFVEIHVSIDLNGNYHYSYSVLDKECKFLRKGYTDFDWTYEDAAEAAIKYCLENLI